MSFGYEQRIVTGTKAAGCGVYRANKTSTKRRKTADPARFRVQGPGPQRQATSFEKLVLIDIVCSHFVYHRNTGRYEYI